MEKELFKCFLIDGETGIEFEEFGDFERFCESAKMSAQECRECENMDNIKTLVPQNAMFSGEKQIIDNMSIAEKVQKNDLSDLTGGYDIEIESQNDDSINVLTTVENSENLKSASVDVVEENHSSEISNILEEDEFDKYFSDPDFPFSRFDLRSVRVCFTIDDILGIEAMKHPREKRTCVLCRRTDLSTNYKGGTCGSCVKSFKDDSGEWLIGLKLFKSVLEAVKTYKGKPVRKKLTKKVLSAEDDRVFDLDVDLSDVKKFSGKSIAEQEAYDIFLERIREIRSWERVTVKIIQIDKGEFLNPLEELKKYLLIPVLTDAKTDFCEICNFNSKNQIEEELYREFLQKIEGLRLWENVKAMISQLDKGGSLNPIQDLKNFLEKI